MLSLAKNDARPLAVRASEALSDVVTMIQKARTLYELRDVQDYRKQVEILMSSRRAAVEMGDKAETLRQKARELRLTAELRQGEILRQMSATDKDRALKELGIGRTEAVHCELASKVPPKAIESLRGIQRRKGLELSVKDVSPVALLDPSQRKNLAVKLGTVKTVRQALDAIKQEKPKEHVNSREDAAAARYMNQVRRIQKEVSTLLLMATRYAEVKKRDALLRTREAQAIVKGLVDSLGDPTI